MLKHLVCMFLLTGALCAQDAFIKKGDSEARVREILGPPTQAGGAGARKTLIYGKSKILLRDAKVISFYPSELKREIAKIRKGGHPQPNIRETVESTPVDMWKAPEASSDNRPSLSELKAERTKLLNDYRAKLGGEIKKAFRGVEVTRKRRKVRAAGEVELNQMAQQYELTKDSVSKGFKGFIGAVRVERKLEEDMVIVTCDGVSKPLLAVGFGLEDTPVGTRGVLGLLRENGTFVETRRNDKEKEFVIIEPIMSRSPYRGVVELTANGFETVKEEEEEEEEEEEGMEEPRERGEGE